MPGATPAAYRPALDGLRAVSILLVVVAHLHVTPLVPGGFGVTLFFFISGYLITGQLLKSLRAGGRIDFAGFYLRRALRLLPAGLTYIVLAGGAFQILGGRISLAGWLAALFYGANYHDIWQGYISNLPGIRHPFNILWSLAVEEHFYALWPALLACLAIGRNGGRRAIFLVLGVCLGVLLWRFWLMHACTGAGADVPAYCGPRMSWSGGDFNRFYEATDTRLDSIGWGAIMALLEGRVTLAGRWRAGAGLALLVLSFALTGPWGRYVLRGTVQGVALLGLVPFLLQPGSWPNRLLCIKPALLLGRLSYSLYLWHWAALTVADVLVPTSGAVWRSLALPLSLALASASYWGIERPVLGVRRHFGSHAT
jgi:peptidoglycan/LPS O-acetylase OafA/YrhL